MAYFIILFFYRAADAVKHFQLYWRGDHFAFGHGIYDNVEELADHFDNKPLLGGESGIYLTLFRAKFICFLICWLTLEAYLVKPVLSSHFERDQKRFEWKMVA